MCTQGPSIYYVITSRGLEGGGQTFLTAILLRGLRNDSFFSFSNLLFPIFIWTFISLFYLDFYFSFLFGLLFSLFYQDFYFFLGLFSLFRPFYFPFRTNRDLILDFFQVFSLSSRLEQFLKESTMFMPKWLWLFFATDRKKSAQLLVSKRLLQF